jgi:hypothetical protein
MVLDCIPAFARATCDLGRALPQGDNSRRPVTAGGQHPSSKTARPLNSRPSEPDDIAARVLDAGEGA